MKTIDYITAARAKAGFRRNTQLAKTLDISDTALSRYEAGERIMDNYTATKIAQILGIDPMTIIAQAEAERERDEHKRAFWENFTQKARAAAYTAALFLVTNFVTTDTAHANHATQTEQNQTSYKLYEVH